MPRLKHFYGENHLHYRSANIHMHNNRVKRGLAAQPGDWPWSSWRHYYLQDSSVLAMDRIP